MCRALAAGHRAKSLSQRAAQSAVSKGTLSDALFSLREKGLEGLAGETSNRLRANPLSQFAAQTAAARDGEDSTSALFSLREKGLVGDTGIEPVTPAV
jgi:hypothetical protein